MAHRTLRRWAQGGLCAALLLAGLPSVMAQTARVTNQSSQAGAQVVVSGIVPDEATRAAILSRVRDIYGSDRVIDQLGVGTVVAPANWSQYVQKLISPQIKQVSHGQLVITGNNIELQGEVANDAQRRQIALDMAGALNPTYSIRNGLRVAAREQSVLDDVLRNRTIEFEPGSSVLRPSGRVILDEMADALRRLGSKRVDVIGHTDSVGNPDSNLALSIARADSVRAYLVTKGISESLINASGMGANRPVASNDTPDGRARNRRIEFRVSQ